MQLTAIPLSSSSLVSAPRGHPACVPLRSSFLWAVPAASGRSGFRRGWRAVVPGPEKYGPCGEAVCSRIAWPRTALGCSSGPGKTERIRYPVRRTVRTSSGLPLYHRASGTVCPERIGQTGFQLWLTGWGTPVLWWSLSPRSHPWDTLSPDDRQRGHFHDEWHTPATGLPTLGHGLPCHRWGTAYPEHTAPAHDPAGPPDRTSIGLPHCPGSALGRPDRVCPQDTVRWDHYLRLCGSAVPPLHLCPPSGRCHPV